MTDNNSPLRSQRPKHAAPQSTPRQNIQKSGEAASRPPRRQRDYGSAPISSHLVPQTATVAPKKKMRTWKKALIGVGIFIVVLLGVGLAWGAWYSGQLNSRLALDDDQATEVGQALAAAPSQGPFYMLVLGSDSREGSGTSNNPAYQGDNERSDVMILMRIDPANKEITMVSIPRDTRYTLPDGKVGKINEAYNIGGAAASIKAVSDLTNVPISHYAEIHFSEFERLVDSLGGIEVNVPVEVSYIDALTGEEVTLQPGKQTLDGQQAQIFARARHEYGDNQDKARQSNVRAIMSALIDKMLSQPFYKLPGTVLDAAECLGTDMKTGDALSLAFAFSGGSGKMTLYSATGPSSGDIDESAGGIWLCYENPQGWAALMASVDAGKDPSDIDVESTAIIPEES